MTNEELIKQAALLIDSKRINDTEIWSVGCVLLSDKWNIYCGVCIDTISWMWFCAEHTAISQMITKKEYKIKKIVAVWKDKQNNIFVIPPCWRCRSISTWN